MAKLAKVKTGTHVETSDVGNVSDTVVKVSETVGNTSDTVEKSRKLSETPRTLSQKQEKTL